MKTTKIAIGAATALFLALLILYLLISGEKDVTEPFFGTMGVMSGPPPSWKDGQTYTHNGKTIHIRQLTFTGIRDVIEVEMDGQTRQYVWVPDDQFGLSGTIDVGQIVPIKKTNYGLRFGDAMLYRI